MHVYAAGDRSARALNGSVVYTAELRCIYSRGEGRVQQVRAWRPGGKYICGTGEGGGRKNTLMDKMFVRKQTGPIVGNRLMGACH